jgi:hypothetical protein
VRSKICALFKGYWLKFQAHFLEEAKLGVFCHFLGGRSSTMLIARLFLVDVSEFLQFFFTLNGYCYQKVTPLALKTLI